MPVDGQCVPQTTSCTPPLVLDPVTKTCVCPQGTVRQGRQCVPQVCPSPLVPGPCKCPDGTVLVDGLCVKTTPIDLGIQKTGGTSPACRVRDYIFTITVTNVGAGWPASGNVVVHDTVPAGMTFTVPPPCVPSGVLSAGTPFTCTYTGPAPAAGQPLPAINIQATANGPGAIPALYELCVGHDFVELGLCR